MSEMSNTGSADTSPDTVNLCNTDRLGNIASLYLAHYLGIDIERFASISKNIADNKWTFIFFNNLASLKVTLSFAHSETHSVTH